MRYEGEVRRIAVAAGSKSEREAVVLDTGGRNYVLRIPGGNPFDMPQLNALVGKRIEAEGTIHGSSIFLHEWREKPTA